MPKKLILKHWGFLLISLISSFVVKGQDSTLRYTASVILSGSTGPTAFWHYANQNGTIPQKSPFGLGKWGISKSYVPGNPKLFQWRAGAEVITSYDKKGNIFFTDLFAAVKIGPVELLAGQNDNRSSFTDSTLSSGSLAVSGNARPFPRLQLAIPDFHPLSFTGGFIALKASYSDGLLNESPLLYGNTSYRPVTYFHQKTLYMRFGLPEHRLSFTAGLNHQVIWGGENRIWPGDSLKLSEAYFHAITGKAAGFKKIGFHFGTIDIAAEWKGLNWSYQLYRQNIYETGSLYSVINLEDGLNGIRIKRTNPLPDNAAYFTLQGLVIEFVSTKNQQNNSPPFGLSIYKNGNYFNSFIYRNGWSYRGYSVGTPLIPRQSSTDGNLPVNAAQYTNNNRLWAIHTGISANWMKTSFLLKATYSANYGSYLTPFDTRVEQLSLLVSAERRLPVLNGIYLTSSVSSDYGSLYPNTIGIMIGVTKKGLIK